MSTQRVYTRLTCLLICREGPRKTRTGRIPGEEREVLAESRVSGPGTKGVHAEGRTGPTEETLDTVAEPEVAVTVPRRRRRSRVGDMEGVLVPVLPTTGVLTVRPR